MYLQIFYIKFKREVVQLSNKPKIWSIFGKILVQLIGESWPSGSPIYLFIYLFIILPVYIPTLVYKKNA